MIDKVNNWLGNLLILIPFRWQNLIVIPVVTLGLCLLCAHPSLFDRVYIYRLGIIMCSLIFPIVVYFSGRVGRPRLIVYAVSPLFCVINVSLVHIGLVSNDYLWGFYVQYLWVFIGWWISKNTLSLKILGVSYVLGIGCISGYALLQSLDLDPLSAVTVFERRRLVATFENPNYFANIVACSLPILSYYFVISRHMGSRYMMGIVLALTYNAWIFSGSRGAWVGGVMGLLVLTLILVTSRTGKKSENKNSLLSYLALFCVIVAISINASEKVVIANAKGKLSTYERLLSIRHVFDPREVGDFSEDVGAASLQIGDTFVHDTTINHRYFIWGITWRMINENPIFGVGYGGFPKHFMEYRNAFSRQEWSKGLSERQKIEETKFPHNEFLHIWVECGILGLISFLWLCLFPTYAYIRKLREVPPICGAMFSSLVVMLVHGLVSYPLHTPFGSFFFWLILGTFIGLLDATWKKSYKTPKEF